MLDTRGSKQFLFAFVLAEYCKKVTAADHNDTAQNLNLRHLLPWENQSQQRGENRVKIQENAGCCSADFLDSDIPEHKTDNCWN